MPKFLIQSSYSAEDLRALRTDKATGRQEATRSAVAALGGRLESMHFVLGDHDVMIAEIVALGGGWSDGNLPDAAALKAQPLFP